MQNLRPIIVGLFVLAVTLLLFLVFFGEVIAACVHPEVFKLLAQLVILGFTGGIGSLVLTEINTSRQRSEAKRLLLRTALGEIVAGYNEIKSVRRLLRAEAVRPNYKDQNAHVLKEPYRLLLRRLNDAQLKLEAQLRLIEGNQAQYPKAETLCELLGIAEKYLGNIISEWEVKLESFKDVPEQNKLVDFNDLRDFLENAPHSFKPMLACPLTKVFAIIGADLGE